MVRSTQITIYTTGTDRPMVHSMALVRDLERRADDGRLLAVRPRGAVHPSRLRRQRAGSGVLGFVLAVAAMVVAPTAAVACDPSVDPSCSDPYWTDPYAGDPYASDPYDSDPYYSDP
ncbi:MAG: hypothetical protein R2710_21950 [Acidimicrobiales bacterium]